MSLSGGATEGLTDSQVKATAARQLVAFAAVAVAASIAVQGVGRLSEHVGRAYLFRDRLIDLPRVLPVWAARDEAQILVIGASTVEQGVFTEIIDEELIRAGRPERTYNFGISSMVPDLLPRVVHLVTAGYRRAGHRPAAIVLELSPDWFTWGANHQMEMDYLAHWGTPSEFLSLMWQTPEDGLILFGRRFALGGYSGDYITFRWSRWLDTDVPRYFGDMTESQRVFALWRQPPSMTVENHGSPRDPEHVAQIQEMAESIHIVRQELIAEEVAELSVPFREDIVQQAIAAIREAQAGADKVFLLFMPRNPCFLPAAFRARADALISRFVKETGASPLDLRSVEGNCDEFEDLMHVLPLTAGGRFSRSLGKALAEQL